MLPVAVAPMLAHYALRRREQQLLSMVCVGHARLGSDRIATAMVVRLVTTRNITMLENASNSLRMKPCSRESVLHAQVGLVQVGLVVARRQRFTLMGN